MSGGQHREDEEDRLADPHGHGGEGDDVHETRSMQAEILMEGAEGGLVGVAVGALTAVGATIWLKLRGRGNGRRR